MYSGNHHKIRHATNADAAALRRLAELDSADPLTGHVLVGFVDDEPAAALSLTTGHTVADPFQPTAYLLIQLRLRAAGIVAYERKPSLRERIIAGLQRPHAQL